MTGVNDLDRALPAWFESETLAPAPPDVLDSVVAITARRRPRPVWLARMHQVTLPRPPLGIGAIPVAAVLWLLLLTAALSVIGATLLMERSRGPDLSVVPPPSQRTIASPGPSPDPGAVPPGLRYAWIGDPRVLPDLGIGTRTKLHFDANAFWGSGTNYPPRVADSRATVEGPSLVLTGAGGDCSAGQRGVYSWSLSPGGTVLTVQPGVDPCEMRATLAPGTWFRTDCRNIQDECLGVLEAGAYKSQYVDPRVNNGAWIPNFGAVTFTVPAGWANSGDFPSQLLLTPAADYANESPDGPAPGAIHEIRLVTQPAAAIQDGSCEANDDPTIGLTVDALVAWLQALPSLEVGAPERITIDGHAGQMLDLRLKPSWTARCPGEAQPSAAILTEAAFHLDSYTIGLAGPERLRLMLLDLGRDDVAAIVIDSSQPDRFDGLVASGMPIVESFRFR
jgi:hypothetical protein